MPDLQQDIKSAQAKQNRKCKELYDKAFAEFRNGKLEEAIIMLYEILAECPEHEEAKQALENLRKVYKNYASAKIASDNEDWRFAISLLKKLHSEYPDISQFKGDLEASSQKQQQLCNTLLSKAEKACSEEQWSDAIEQLHNLCAMCSDDDLIKDAEDLLNRAYQEQQQSGLAYIRDKIQSEQRSLLKAERYTIIVTTLTGLIGVLLVVVAIVALPWISYKNDSITNNYRSTLNEQENQSLDKLINEDYLDWNMSIRQLTIADSIKVSLLLPLIPIVVFAGDIIWVLLFALEMRPRFTSHKSFLGILLSLSWRSKVLKAFAFTSGITTLVVIVLMLLSSKKINPLISNLQLSDLDNFLTYARQVGPGFWLSLAGLLFIVIGNFLFLVKSYYVKPYNFKAFPVSKDP